MQLEPDDLRNQHRYRLSEHCSLGFDSTDSPAEYAQSVDHRRVGIRSHERVRVSGSLAVNGVGEDALGQVFEIDLVHDARVGRNHAEILEGVLSPAKKRIALLVAVELQVCVDEERGVGSVFVDLNGVIDDEVDRLERVDLRSVAAESRERVAHCGEVHDRGNSGEILEKDSRGAERDFFLLLAADVPVCQRFDVLALDELSVLVPEEVFQEDLEAEGEGCCLAAGRRIERVEAIDGVLSPSGLER